MARRKYVVGNWKMNGLKAALDEAASQVERIVRRNPE